MSKVKGLGRDLGVNLVASAIFTATILLWGRIGYDWPTPTLVSFGVLTFGGSVLSIRMGLAVIRDMAVASDAAPSVVHLPPSAAESYLVEQARKFEQQRDEEAEAAQRERDLRAQIEQELDKSVARADRMNTDIDAANARTVKALDLYDALLERANAAQRALDDIERILAPGRSEFWNAIGLTPPGPLPPLEQILKITARTVAYRTEVGPLGGGIWTTGQVTLKGAGSGVIPFVPLLQDPQPRMLPLAQTADAVESLSDEKAKHDE